MINTFSSNSKTMTGQNSREIVSNQAQAAKSVHLVNDAINRESVDLPTLNVSNLQNDSTFDKIMQEPQKLEPIVARPVRTNRRTEEERRMRFSSVGKNQYSKQNIAAK